MPWVETIYYGRQQNGYHGGATPQEMVSPLVILMDKTSTYSGLFPCEYPKPEWWLAPPVASAMVEEPRIRWPIVKPPNGRKASSTTRFDAEEVRDRPGHYPTHSRSPFSQAMAVWLTAWLDHLLASNGLQKIKRNFVRRRTLPNDGLMRRCLAALDSSGGIMTPAAFSKAADIPAAARLDGLIARIQRLLERGRLRNPDL